MSVIDISEAPYNVKPSTGADVGAAIQQALKDSQGTSAKPTRTVHFPAGQYVTNVPLDITGCRLTGEPMRPTGGSIIKAGAEFGLYAPGGATDPLAWLVRKVGFVPVAGHPGYYELPIYGGVPLAVSGDVRPSVAAHVPPNDPIPLEVDAAIGSGATYVYGLRFDAGSRDLLDPTPHPRGTPITGQASYAVALLGASGRLDTCEVQHAARANILGVDASMHFDYFAAMVSDGHGLWFVNCNGTVLRDFILTSWGTLDPEAAGIRIERAADPMVDGKTPRADGTVAGIPGGGITLRDGVVEPRSSDGKYMRVFTPGTGGPAIHVVATGNVSVLDGLYVESDGVSDGIHLDGCQYTVVTNSRIQAGQQARLRGNDVPARPVRLSNGAQFNRVFGNYLIGSAKTPGDPPAGPYASDSVQIDDDTSHNHVNGNTAMRVAETGAPARFGSDGSPEPSSRTDTFGQRHFVAHAPDQPKLGDWRQGDLIFNSAPVLGSPAGWACTASAGGKNAAGWVPFGVLGADNGVKGQRIANWDDLAKGTVTVDGIAVVVVTGGAGPLTSLSGGYDGQTVVLVSASDAPLPFGTGGNIHLAPGADAHLGAGGTCTLIRATLAGSADASLPDGTRWIETARTGGHPIGPPLVTELQDTHVHPPLTDRHVWPKYIHPL